MLPTHKTKIICTIGPASESEEVLRGLIQAGMNVARLNFSHGDFETHARIIQRLRRLSQETGRRVALMADLPGPKIRVGEFAHEPVVLKRGQSFILTIRPVVGDQTRAAVSWPKLPQVVRPGHIIYLADGLIQLRVEKVEDTEVFCQVLVGGELRSRKGINLPGIDLGESAFTARDKEALKFALEYGIEAISQSFVGRAEDIHAVRQTAAELGARPFIIAKIERALALEHLDEILAAADGLMIARGDLGVEIPLERIAVVQKALIKKALLSGKPVITATQMLESMTTNRRPTRAEATDVANAILDGTDAVMLSEESATGRYPVEACAMLARIAEHTEPHLERERFVHLLAQKGRGDLVDLFTQSLNLMLGHLRDTVVFCPTETGATARKAARFRLPCWIMAISNHQKTCQELLFSFGVWPHYQREKPCQWSRELQEVAALYGLDVDKALLIEGPSPTHPTATHRLELVRLES